MPTPTSDVLARAGLSRPVLARTLPFAVYAAFLGMEALLGASGPADLRWLYAARVAAVAAVLACYWNDYAELRWGDTGGAGGMLFATAAGVIVLVLWINLDSGWTTLGGPSGGFVALDRDGAREWGLIIVRIAGAALVVPLMEELFWRSFIQRWLEKPGFLDVDPRAVGLRSLLVTSIAFGFEHGQWLAGIIAGLAYGELYRRSGRLWLPVLAHAMTNFLLGVWVVHTGQWQFW